MSDLSEKEREGQGAPFRSLLNARLPPVMLRIRQILAGSNLDPSQIEELLRLDPILAAQVLRHSQDPPAHTGEPPGTLWEATLRLGAPVLQRLCEPVEVPGDFLWQEMWSRTGRLYEHSIATAAAARALMRTVDRTRCQQAYLAGLLHDLGRFLMLERHGEPYLEYALDLDCDPTPEGERQRFGETHEEWGRQVATAWNLPQVFCDVLQNHHLGSGEKPAAHSMTGIITVAECVVNRAGLGFCRGLNRSPRWEDVLSTLACSPRLEERLVQEVFEFLRRAARMFGSSYCGPGDLARCYEGTPPLPDRRRAARHHVSSITLLLRALEQKESETELGLWLRDVALTRTSFERAFVLLYREDDEAYSEVLRGEETSGRRPLRWVKGSSRRRLEVPTRGFLRLRPDGEDPDALLEALHSDDLSVIPLHGGGRGAPVGILCCDRRYSGGPPRRQDLCLLEVLARAVGQEIERRRVLLRLESYREDAERDYLTGIYNRRTTMRLLEREILRARRNRSPLALILLDIDRFKTFNDIYGHLTGDLVLREVSRLLNETARTSDIVGRYGGEEFLIVLPDTTVENAYMFAERLRGVVEDYGKAKAAQYPRNPPTISIGVSWVIPDRDTPEDAIERVDKALYGSKKSGRNKVCLEPAELGAGDEEESA